MKIWELGVCQKSNAPNMDRNVRKINGGLSFRVKVFSRAEGAKVEIRKKIKLHFFIYFEILPFNSL